MSNYVRTSDFASKDGLASGTALKALKGTELGLEFDNIATMSATKVDNASNASLLSLVLTGNTVPANGIYLPAANTIGIATNSTLRGSVNSTGNWGFVAPTSGNALTLNGAASTPVLLLNAPTSNSVSIEFDINSVLQGQLSFSGGASQVITGSASGDMCLRTQNTAIRLSANAGASSQAVLTPAGLLQAVDQGGSLWDLGWRDMPANVQAGTYTLALSDRGKFIVAGGNLTIPAEASINFPVGSTIGMFNNTGGNLTISSTDGIILTGTGSTGTRTVVVNGFATMFKRGSASWLVSGSGVS